MQRGGQGGTQDQRKGRRGGAESHVAVGAALAVELADLGARAHHLPPRPPRLLQHRPPRGAAAFRGMVSTHRLRDAGPVRGAARLDGGCQPLGLRLGPCRGVAVDLAPLGRRRSRQRRVGVGAAVGIESGPYLFSVWTTPRLLHLTSGSAAALLSFPIFGSWCPLLLKLCCTWLW